MIPFHISSLPTVIVDTICHSNDHKKSHDYNVNSSPTLKQAGHIACTKGLHEIFKYAHLKFTVYGCNIHTTSANAVTLVWGSLRLPQ